MSYNLTYKDNAHYLSILYYQNLYPFSTILHNIGPSQAHHRESGQIPPWLGTIISAEAFIMVGKKRHCFMKGLFFNILIHLYTSR